ncbi:18704_t:CDS:2, partial [Gigaspora margarita]
YLTKWLEACVLSEATASAVATFLIKDIICCHASSKSNICILLPNTPRLTVWSSGLTELSFAQKNSRKLKELVASRNGENIWFLKRTYTQLAKLQKGAKSIKIRMVISRNREFMQKKLQKDEIINGQKGEKHQAKRYTQKIDLETYNRKGRVIEKSNSLECSIRVSKKQGGKHMQINGLQSHSTA